MIIGWENEIKLCEQIEGYIPLLIKEYKEASKSEADFTQLKMLLKNL